MRLDSFMTIPLTLGRCSFYTGGTGEMLILHWRNWRDAHFTLEELESYPLILGDWGISNYN